MCSPDSVHRIETLELEETSKIIHSNPSFLEIEELRPKEILSDLLKTTWLIATDLEPES